MAIRTLKVGTLSILFVTLLAAVFNLGFSCKPEQRPGNFEPNPNPGLTESQLESIEHLKSLGYLSYSSKKIETGGVTVHDKRKTQPGYNLFTTSHGTQAFLINMEGRILHKWAIDQAVVFPDSAHEENGPPSWRRAHLEPNGDLYVQSKKFALLKLDKDSRLLWHFDENPHHDFFVDENDYVHTLTRKAHINEKYNPAEPILEDYITVLDPDGKPVKSISILDCLENSEYWPVYSRMDKAGDILHTNSLQLLDGTFAQKNPAFAKGNYLLSIREIDMVAVIDPEKMSVVWALSGLFDAQHEASFTEKGHILLFDNKGYRGKSQVLEIDPATKETSWSFRGNGHPFYSEAGSFVRRLKNSNTLITISYESRAIEVTPSKEIVWEYKTALASPDEKTKNAVLFEMIRLPENCCDWVNQSSTDNKLAKQSGS